MAKDKSKLLDITKNEVKAKKLCNIIINLEEYKNVSEEIVENEASDENELVLVIHGFFDIIFPEEMDSVSFSLPYAVNLYKHNIKSSSSKELVLEFEPGDTIFTAHFKNKNTNIDVLSALFQNRVKYISDDIYELIINIYTQLSGVTNIDFFNIETIVSQMFAEEINSKLVPLRLTNKKYSKNYAIDFTKSSHNFSNILGFSYGYTNNYLLNKVTDVHDKKKLDNSYLEDIITNKYTNIKNKENKNEK
jgi:hypothetical protein